MTITVKSILNNPPSETEVERVDALWASFDSTTQFLSALAQVLRNREITNEERVLAQLLPAMAQVEADDLNTPLQAPTQKKEFWNDPCWRQR